MKGIWISSRLRKRDRADGDCIRATKISSHPGSLYERSFATGTYHFGNRIFHQTDSLVRTEVELRTGRFPDGRRKVLALEQHQFFTTMPAAADKGRDEI